MNASQGIIQEVVSKLLVLCLCSGSVRNCIYSLFLTCVFRHSNVLADQELDQARREIDQLDASGALHHGAMLRLSEDRLDWCLKLHIGLGVGTDRFLIVSSVAGASGKQGRG